MSCALHPLHLAIHDPPQLRAVEILLAHRMDARAIQKALKIKRSVYYERLEAIERITKENCRTLNDT